MKNNKINNNNERKVVDATSVKKIVSGAIITGAIIAGTGGVFADATDSKYDMDYKGVGYIGVAEEVGPNGNGGFISTGEGDAGGISYGIMQLTSKAGGASANTFVFKYLKNNHPEFYAFFKDAGKAGTNSFSSAWTKAYNYNPGEFEEIQMKYKEDVYVAEAVNKVKEATGIDLLSTRAKAEWVYSTSVQFGPSGTLQMVKSAGVTKDMDDKEFIERVSDAKRNSVGVTKFLGCSSSVRRSVYNRFTREEKELLKIVLEEQGLSLEELLNGEVEEGASTDSLSPMEDKEVLGDNIEVDEEIKEYVEENFDRDASVSADEKDGDNLDTDPENDDESNDEDESVVDVEPENEDESVVDTESENEDESVVDTEPENEDESVVDTESENEDESVVDTDNVELETKDESTEDDENENSNTGTPVEDDEIIIDLNEKDTEAKDEGLGNESNTGNEGTNKAEDEKEASSDDEIIVDLNNEDSEAKDEESSSESNAKNDDLEKVENEKEVSNDDMQSNNNEDEVDSNKEENVDKSQDVESTENDTNGEKSVDVGVNATSLSTLSESELRTQELEEKLKDNLFHNLFTRLQ